MAKNTEELIHVGTIQPITAEKILRRMSGAAGIALKEVRCAKCSKLLFKGTMQGEIKCRKCGLINRW